jgi:hypothetical protein
MADPTAWILEEETETDRLRTALAEARADLQRRDMALLKLQSELMASRLEVAGAREEMVQYQGLLCRMEEPAAHARVGLESAVSRNAEITQLRAVIATLQAETLALRAGIDIMRASASWRISAPVRMVGRLTRGFREAALGLLRAIQPVHRHKPALLAQRATTLPNPGEPHKGTLFQASPFVKNSSGQAEGVVTLEVLYHLSRSL